MSSRNAEETSVDAGQTCVWIIHEVFAHGQMQIAYTTINRAKQAIIDEMQCAHFDPTNVTFEITDDTLRLTGTYTNPFNGVIVHILNAHAYRLH